MASIDMQMVESISADMSEHQPLHGGCSCGRIQYQIIFPSPTSSSTSNEPRQAQVIFSTNPNDRRTQATPLAAWLRVPLTWYASTTQAYAPDETHASIRRTYIPEQRQSEKRHFCAYCGTHLSRWTEDPPSESEWIAVTVGSLGANSLRGLEELGLLSTEPEFDQQASRESLSRLTEDDEDEGSMPWFKSLVEGSALGRVTRRSGTKTHGSHRVEWEVYEWIEDPGDNAAMIGKRKRARADGADVHLEDDGT